MADYPMQTVARVELGPIGPAIAVRSKAAAEGSDGWIADDNKPGWTVIYPSGLAQFIGDDSVWSAYVHSAVEPLTLTEAGESA